MASSQSSQKSNAARPGIQRVSSAAVTKSDAAQDDDESLKLPKRAQTYAPGDSEPEASTFETGENTDTEDGVEATRNSVELDSLPIELISLTDSFIDSLGAKVHPTPPSIDRLSQLFQNFYAQASSHINTHINALATKHSREAPSTQSISSLSSAASRLRSKTSTLNINKEKQKPEAEQQMITSEELTDRRQARKALESKRNMLEEAVERRLCEGIYDRIYRHKSTQDEAQDEKLRSKTAALSLVGIGPADLGVDLGESGEDTTALSSDAIQKKTEDIKTWLEQARKDLVHMSESRYPLGKLNRLKAAHRSIVDTIAQFHPSASADEIMPMLIFTLVTLPPENLHVISDSRFIQSFRWEPKLTGEAAYCLTNLEAAISFLETVDLSTLRSDELPSGPPKNATPGVSRTETFPPAYQGVTAASQSPPETSKANATAAKPAPPAAALKPANVLRNRRLSDLVNTPAQAFGAASDAVMTTADQGLKTVSNSLGDSYKFLLGKLREHQDSPREPIIVPRTLDDARKLVSTPPPDEDGVDEGDELKRPSAREDRVLNMIGGRRDHSTDSAVSGRSASSSRLKVLFNDENKAPATPTSNPSSNNAGTQNAPVLDQMRSLSNSFNPMARITNQLGMIRGFGRNTPSSPATNEAHKVADGGDLATAFPDLAAALPPKTGPPKIAPANKRFMELQNPGDLKLNEVLELLRDYRRLAGALEKRGAFEEK